MDQLKHFREAFRPCMDMCSSIETLQQIPAAGSLCDPVSKGCLLATQSVMELAGLSPACDPSMLALWRAHQRKAGAHRRRGRTALELVTNWALRSDFVIIWP